MDYDKCTFACRDKLIVLPESESKLTLRNENQKTVKKIKVDKCLITDETMNKCDWIVELKLSKKDIRVAYIELKGGACKVTDALKQLDSTIEKTRDYFSKHTKAAYVIGGQLPRATATDRQERDRFIKKNKMQLYTKPKVCEMELINLWQQ
jgi:hypothetical protein